MVEDVVVNLSVVEGRDPACDYALSVAHAFNAHLAGIAFAYDPVLAISGEAMPPKWIEEQHAKAAEAADAAVAKFEEGARRVGLSADWRCSIQRSVKAMNCSGRLRDGSISQLFSRTIRKGRQMRTWSSRPLSLIWVDRY